MHTVRTQNVINFHTVEITSPLTYPFTGYDIRASINNLQFAALKSSQEKQRDAEGTL